MTDPQYIYPEYRSTQLRGPKKPLVILPDTLSELTGPAFGKDTVSDVDANLALGRASETARRTHPPLRAAARGATTGKSTGR